jgi:hypothetical protein
MSHSTKLALGGGGGGTLDKLTANVGLPAVPDGANNINIVGVGTIQTLVDPLAPNTVQITSSEATATFDCDAGSAAPALGVIQVIGTAQEIETLGFGNTIQIGLPANINIANTLTVGTDITAFGSIIATNDIDSTLGSFHAPFGDLVVGGSVQGADLQIAGMATIGGPVSLSWFLRGFLYVDDTGVVHTSEGQNGQVLIGNTGGPSLWRTLTPGYGIQIVDGPNSIILSTSDVIARNYNTDVGTAVPVANILSILGGTNIETSAVGSVVTIATKADVIFDTIGATTVTITDLVQAARATITGIVNAGTLVTTTVNVSGAITCDSLTAAADIIAGNDLTVNHDATVGGDLEVTGDIIGHEDAVIPGDLRLSGHTDGVLITDTTGFIDASNGSPTGTNGQILISGGARPTWHALESADGSVAITYPGNNRINLRATASTPSVLFGMTMLNTVPWAANNVEVLYDMGQKLALHIAVDTNAACYAGDGAAQPAYFSPPYEGYYYLNAQMTVRNTAYWECKNAAIFFYNYTTHKSSLDNRQYLASAFNGAGMAVDPYTATLTISGLLRLKVGNHYGVRIYLHSRSDGVSQHYTLGSALIGPDLYDSVTDFTGFLVYRL